MQYAGPGQDAMVREASRAGSGFLHNASARGRKRRGIPKISTIGLLGIFNMSNLERLIERLFIHNTLTDCSVPNIFSGH